MHPEVVESRIMPGRIARKKRAEYSKKIVATLLNDRKLTQILIDGRTDYEQKIKSVIEYAKSKNANDKTKTVNYLKKILSRFSKFEEFDEQSAAIRNITRTKRREEIAKVANRKGFNEHESKIFREHVEHMIESSVNEPVYIIIEALENLGYMYNPYLSTAKH